MGFVTVNSKSLVVVPKAVRDECGLRPGDKLKVIYDKEYDKGKGAIVMKKIDDVRSISQNISGIWANNDFSLQEQRESQDERIERILKNKLREKRAV